MDVTLCIDQNRRAYYDPSKFDDYFKQFDTVGDNLLSKSEMTALIKKVYSKKNAPIAIPEKTKEDKLKANA